MGAFQLPPETMLKRDETARALRASGYPMAAATLARKACVGGGPPFAIFGRNAMYRWGDVLAWVHGRLIRHQDAA